MAKMQVQLLRPEPSIQKPWRGAKIRHVRFRQACKQQHKHSVLQCDMLDEHEYFITEATETAFQLSKRYCPLCRFLMGMNPETGNALAKWLETRMNPAQVNATVVKLRLGFLTSKWAHHRFMPPEVFCI